MKDEYRISHINIQKLIKWHISLVAVLVLYLTKDLMFNKPEGKSIYHAFSMTSYFTGVIGAMVADSWLGKYK